MKKVTRLTEGDLTRIVKRVVKENKSNVRPLHQIIDDFLYGFEFSQKGNDEMLIFIDYLLNRDGCEHLAKWMFGKLKRGHATGGGLETFATDQDKLEQIANQLKDVKD